MDTLNRIVLAIVFVVVFFISVVGILVTLDFLTVEPVKSFAGYLWLVDIIGDSFLPLALSSIWLLVVIMTLGILWLRGQFLGTTRATTGGIYEPVGVPGPGITDVSRNLIGQSIDLAVSGIPGVVSSDTRVYSDNGGVYTDTSTAKTFLIIKRGVDPHEVDKTLRRMINRAWFLKMGSEVIRHDVSIGITRTTQRVI